MDTLDLKRAAAQYSFTLFRLNSLNSLSARQYMRFTTNAQRGLWWMRDRGGFRI